MKAGAYQYRCRGSRRQTGPAGWGKSGGGGGGGAASGMSLLASSGVMARPTRGDS